MAVLHPQLDSRRSARDPQGLDPRGPRCAAAITTVVLALALLTLPSPLATVLVAIQTLCFAIGAFAGPARQPYALLFRRFVRPRLAPPVALEAPEPVRFAQGVGLVFAVVGLVALLTGLTPLAYVALGAAFVAAFLNAAFDFCLGCEMHLLLTRLRRRAA